MSEPEQPSSSEPPPEGAAPEPPPVPAVPPAPPPPASRAQGPLGKPRGVLFVIVLSIVTLGIYHLYWVFKTFDELKRHTGEGIGGVLGLVIALVISPVNYFVMPSEIGKMYRGDGRAAPMTGLTGLWILLPIVGLIVWVVKVQRALNRYWQSKAALA